MSSGTFGKKAVELVREIADSEPGSIPPYNQDLIRTVIDQCEDHHRELGRLASEYTDATTALEGAADEEEDERQSTQNRVRVGMLAHHQVRRDATDAARDGTGRDGTGRDARARTRRRTRRLTMIGRCAGVAEK